MLNTFVARKTWFPTPHSNFNLATFTFENNVKNVLLNKGSLLYVHTYKLAMLFSRLCFTWESLKNKNKTKERNTKVQDCGKYVMSSLILLSFHHLSILLNLLWSFFRKSFLFFWILDSNRLPSHYSTSLCDCQKRDDEILWSFPQLSSLLC